MKRLSLIGITTCIAVVVEPAISTGVWAQVFPAKPIRMLLSGPAGGGADTIARPIAQKLSELLGQQVIVDNRPGAGGVIAAQAAAIAAADGYSLMFTSASTLVIAPMLHKKPPYDPVKDFAPITLVAVAPLLVAVHPSLPVKSIKELIALARAKPGQLLYASNGRGSISHLATELFAQAADIKVIHVPYKGGAAAVLDTVSGQVQFAITAVPTLIAQVKANRLRALAVTGSVPSKALPQLPTVRQSGLPGYEVVQWYGLFTPRGTAEERIAKLYDATVRAAASPSIQTPLLNEGADLATTGADALAKVLRADIEKWQRVVRDTGVVLE